ncbi:hypothetical protein P168DRAFT_285012 [Aspergillus campestris IBT 28561]|uniref:C2H2-type domain-containing protein n=1 Tax=Aspergillus campestris (strain IBT 28561) TaxID=1392248 RepID=A0A2I1CT93_ASPC2|nr:uncharacterized protein P168DRAFT_285012 [Aspergillus campestris IBT 28561]PKY00856.1 hypothetical protein P168DRAFT_285012 [Aspergillus campestris IBT 28561]
MTSKSDHYETLVGVGRRVSSRFSVVEGLIGGNGEVSVTKAMFVNELQRFELWSINLGLYQSGHSSLDYRFRDSPTLFYYALGLLQDLESALNQLALILYNHNQPQEDARKTGLPEHTEDWSHGEDCEDSSGDEDSEDFSSYQTEPMDRVVFANTVTTIDRLYQLSFRIRNPRMRMGLSKALQYTEYDSDTGINLMDEYAKLDINHIEELFRSYGRIHTAGTHNYLIQRLARANTRRRQQFRYWKKRKTKYERFSKPEIVEKTSQHLSGDPSGLGQALHIPNAAPSQPSTVTYLNMSKIKDDDSENDDDASIRSTNLFVLKADEKNSDQAAIPPPPKNVDVKEFECPYCCTMCPRKLLANKAWEPYVCTYKYCSDPDQQYDSFSDWVTHETLRHKLTSQSTSHECEIGESQSINREVSTVDTLTTRECPFCLIRDATQIHIACHLRRIACFAIRGAGGGEENDDIEANSGMSDRAEIHDRSSERLSVSSLSWTDNTQPHGYDKFTEKGRCPHPDCGRVFTDLNAHMLTHQSERPNKCPIVGCEYHIRGFERNHDQQRHTMTHYKGTMVCGFCTGPEEKIFNRADLFKRHLTIVHGVEHISLSTRKHGLVASNKVQSDSSDTPARCSVCSVSFSNAQEFYEHLDDCVIRMVQQVDPSESVNQKRLKEVESDEEVKKSLKKHGLLGEE